MLGGCGGGGGGGSTSPNNPDSPIGGEKIPMELNKLYTVYRGDTILKNSDDALVWVKHQDGEATSEVKLVQGSATIVRR